MVYIYIYIYIYIQLPHVHLYTLFNHCPSGRWFKMVTKILGKRRAPSKHIPSQIKRLDHQFESIKTDRKWVSYKKILPKYKIIYIHHHHHVVPLARISLTLSGHFSQSFIASGRSSGLHPVSSHSCWMYVRAGRPAFARPYVESIGVHHLWARPCFSTSVLHVWFV